MAVQLLKTLGPSLAPLLAANDARPGTAPTAVRASTDISRSSESAPAF
jgi:hypothetical protein